MNGTAAAVRRGISPTGWLLAGSRITGMLALLVLCLPLHFLWRLFTPHNIWPRIFLGGVCRIAGIRVKQAGQPCRSGTFLLANHVSWIDIPALASATGAAFVAHDGLTIVPLVHWLCRLNDTVFVARHDRSSVQGQIEQVRQAIRESGALAIFPEGTTSDGAGLLPFKSSLLSALTPVPEGIAVQPVLLDYGPEAAGIAWVGEEHGLDNFLRVLARLRPVRLTLHFLPPLDGKALADRKLMARTARAEMLAALSAQRVTL